MAATGREAGGDDGAAVAGHVRHLRLFAAHGRWAAAALREEALGAGAGGTGVVLGPFLGSKAWENDGKPWRSKENSGENHGKP